MSAPLETDVTAPVLTTVVVAYPATAAAMSAAPKTSFTIPAPEEPVPSPTTMIGEDSVPSAD